jgi:hypothetical protein
LSVVSTLQGQGDGLPYRVLCSDAALFRSKLGCCKEHAGHDFNLCFRPSCSASRSGCIHFLAAKAHLGIELASVLSKSFLLAKISAISIIHTHGHLIGLLSLSNLFLVEVIAEGGETSLPLNASL